MSNDIDSLARTARENGQEADGPREGARARPDGAILRWKTLAIQTDLSEDSVDPIPFFIEWAAESVHPSQDSPKGCELQSFALQAADPSAVRKVLTAIGIDAKVEQARTIALRATLTTPRGNVELS